MLRDINKWTGCLDLRNPTLVMVTCFRKTKHGVGNTGAFYPDMGQDAFLRGFGKLDGLRKHPLPHHCSCSYMNARRLRYVFMISYVLILKSPDHFATRREKEIGKVTKYELDICWRLKMAQENLRRGIWPPPSRHTHTHTTRNRVKGDNFDLFPLLYGAFGELSSLNVLVTASIIHSVAISWRVQWMEKQWIFW